MKTTLDFFTTYQLKPTPSDKPYHIIMHRKSGEHFAIREIPLHQQMVATIMETLQEHRKLTHFNLLSLIDYSITAQEDDLMLLAIYRIGVNSLLQIINSRAQQNRRLEENQLWKIMHSLVSVLSNLQKQSIGYGTIYLDSAYISEQGVMKLLDPTFAENPLIMNTNRYYSPQMLHLLSRQSQQPEHQSQEQINVFKSDVFVLALCMLHCATLSPMHSRLNYHSGIVDFDGLEEDISDVAQNYSEELVQIIVSMLDESVETRPDFVDLENILHKLIPKQSTSRLNSVRRTTNMIQSTLRVPESMNRSMRSNNTIPMPLACQEEEVHNDPGYPSQFFDVQTPDVISSPQEEECFILPKLSTIKLSSENNNNTMMLSDTSIQPFQYQRQRPTAIKTSKRIKERVIRNEDSELRMEYSASGNAARDSLPLTGYLPPFNPQSPKQSQLYTDPKLLLQLREDLKKLGKRTSAMMLPLGNRDKQNYLLNK